MVKTKNLVVVATLLPFSLPIFAVEPFKSEPINIPNAHSALNIVHHNRSYSGGFSALWISPDCTNLIAVSDYSQVPPHEQDWPVRRSGWYQATISYSTNNKLQSLAVTQQGQLLDIDGKVLQGAAESMEWDGEGFLISFDGRGDIYRYGGKMPEGRLLNGTPVVAYAQKNLGEGNHGLEAMTVLRNGDVFTLFEKLKGADMAQGSILSKTDKPQIFTYAALRNPGGATTLTDGSVLIVEKQWLGIGKGQRLRLVRLSPDSLKGSLKGIKGKVIMDDKSIEYDNNEGVSSCNRGGKEWAFVVTDDNGDWPTARVEDKGKKRQRTLLMQFDITVPKH